MALAEVINLINDIVITGKVGVRVGPQKIVREDGTEAFLHSLEISDFPKQPRTLVDSDVFGFSPASCSVLINPIFARTPKTTFSRLNAATIYGPSWSVRRHGRSSSVGPAVFLGFTANPRTLGHSWNVRRHGRSSQCGTCGFLGLTANPQHTFGPSSIVRLHGRSSQCGTRGFPGLTRQPSTLLVPPGVCGSMAVPRSVGPAVFLGSPLILTLWVPPGVCGAMTAPRSVGPAVFLGSLANPQHFWSLLECAAPSRSSSVGPVVYSGSPPTLNI